MAAPKNNKYHFLRKKSGAKPFYDSPEELTEAIIKYFQQCDKGKKKPTVTGLSLELGFSGRSALTRYKEKEDFVDIIKKALSVVEKGYEELMQDGKSTAIFALKNMGWTDRVEIDNNHSGEMKVSHRGIETTEEDGKSDSIE